jgi:erythronate-4-phosphate dehydrogenase
VNPSDRKIKIIADINIPYLQGILEPFASVEYREGKNISHYSLMDADAILIGTRTRCDRDLIEGTPVKFIATATIGFDHIDTEFCERQGIRWTSAPGCNSGSVQQYIASVLAHLALRRGLVLRGKTIGIIGVGHVGEKVEALCRLFGMDLLMNDPPRERNECASGFVPIEAVLAESDIVTLHVPLIREGIDKTIHMIDQKALKALKPQAWLINTSRGAVVDENALKDALIQGKLAGAVLDVWENEPCADPQLVKLATLATPHIAGYSADGKRNGTVSILRHLADFFDLPFEEFRIPTLPEPPEPEIFPDPRGKSSEGQFLKAILYTYDIAEDDQKFRSAPGRFEDFRNHYPLRREFHAYRLKTNIPEAGSLFSQP